MPKKKQPARDSLGRFKAVKKSAKARKPAPVKGKRAKKIPRDARGRFLPQAKKPPGVKENPKSRKGNAAYSWVYAPAPIENGPNETRHPPPERAMFSTNGIPYDTPWDAPRVRAKFARLIESVARRRHAGIAIGVTYRTGYFDELNGEYQFPPQPPSFNTTPFQYKTWRAALAAMPDFVETALDQGDFAQHQRARSGGNEGFIYLLKLSVELIRTPVRRANTKRRKK